VGLGLLKTPIVHNMVFKHNAKKVVEISYVIELLKQLLLKSYVNCYYTFLTVWRISMNIIGRILFVLLTWPAVAFIDVPNIGWSLFLIEMLDFVRYGDKELPEEFLDK
jgi:hypothetical protein